MQEGTIKVVVSAKVLQDIMAKDPQVQVELIDSAIAQIAGRVAKTVADKVPAVSLEVERAFQAQVAQLKNHTKLHPEVKTLIRSFIDAECKAAVEAALRKEVTEQALTRVNDLVKARMDKFEKDMQQRIETRMAALDAQLDRMAGEAFLKIARGAGTAAAIVT